VALFFPSRGPTTPFEMRQQKHGLQLQKSGVMRKENNKEKKGKKSDGGCSCKVLFSLFGVVKILSFMMIQPPLSSFQCPPSIQSLNLAHFDSVLGPKKNPSNQSRELGQKSFSRPEIPAFNTRYSNGNILSF